MRHSLFRKYLIILVLSLFSTIACASGLMDNINCGLNTLLGGDCQAIQRINAYQEEEQQRWMDGEVSATQSVRNIIAFHKSIIPIDSYNRELYMYNLQVAKACDDSLISKERGLYLMTNKENQLAERIRANQPPQRVPLHCNSTRSGDQITTNCY